MDAALEELKFIIHGLTKLHNDMISQINPQEGGGLSKGSILGNPEPIQGDLKGQTWVSSHFKYAT